MAEKEETFRADLAKEGGRTTEYDIVTEDCGQVGDMHYTRISIDPVRPEEVPDEDIDVDITCIQEIDVKNGMQYSTIIIDETAFSEAQRAFSTETYHDTAKKQKVQVVKGLKLKKLAGEETNDTSCARMMTPEEYVKLKQEEKDAGLYDSDPTAQKFFKFSRIIPNNDKSNQPLGSISEEEKEKLKFSKYCPIETSENQTHIGNEDEEEGIFASDPDALKYLKFSRIEPLEQTETIRTVRTTIECAEEEEGIFASDPDALKFLKFTKIEPKSNPMTPNNSYENGLRFSTFTNMPNESVSKEEPFIFAGDDDDLQYFKLANTQHESSVTAKSTNEKEEPVIFAGDDDDLQYFKPANTQHESSVTAKSTNEKEEPVIFAGDDDDLKYFKLANTQHESSVTAKSTNEKEEPVIFAGDDDDLKYFKLANHNTNSNKDEHAVNGKSSITFNDIKLKNNENYNVNVCSKNLPDGLKKKFVSVTSAETNIKPVDIDQLKATVETTVRDDGMVEEFLSVV